MGGTENYVDPLFSNMQTYCTLREAAIFEPCVQHLKNLSNKMGAILFDMKSIDIPLNSHRQAWHESPHNVHFIFCNTYTTFLIGGITLSFSPISKFWGPAICECEKFPKLTILSDGATLNFPKWTDLKKLRYWKLARSFPTCYEKALTNIKYRLWSASLLKLYNYAWR